MATPIIMPKQGQSVESCIIAKWHKQKGDTVSVGDILFTYETDKATFDEEAKEAGTLLDLFYEEGDDVPCLLNVCVIGNPGEDTSAFRPDGAAAPVAEAPAANAAAPVAAPAAPAAKVITENTATPVIMPKQGQSVESCIIAKWHKQKGDTVSEGDVLFTYETDKATFDEEAKVSGILLDVFFEEGDDVPCLTNVCAIGKEGNTTEELRPGGSVDAAPAAPVAAAVAPAPKTAVATGKAGETTKISPRARGLAARRGVDASMATPTGPNGRIIERDVQALVDSGQGFLSAAAEGYKPGMVGTGIGGRVRVEDLTASPAPAEKAEAAPAANVAAFEDVKLPNIRKVIAKSMHASLSEMAQLTLNSSFDAAEIMGYRSKVKNSMETLGLANITLNDIVLYAVSRVLKNHKDLNAHFLGDTMRYYNVVNLGIAVDTPRGLMVPTLFGADSMSLNEIAMKSKELAKACQSGTISPDMLSGGSFTVTNLGSLGIESFTPVINPPQTGILGVDTITTGVKEVGGELKPYKKMGLSLTFDHRAVDGAPAARFLQELTRVLENFSILLAK